MGGIEIGRLCVMETPRCDIEIEKMWIIDIGTL